MRAGLLVNAALLWLASTGFGGQWAVPRGDVTFLDGARVRVEIADTPATRQRGLMFRTNLAEQEGMLFVFEEPGQYSFWMQNCLIALDIIWLDWEARVVGIAASVPPCRLPDCPPPCGSTACPTYSHQGQATYAVEVAAGFAARHTVRVGDRLVIGGLRR